MIAEAIGFALRNLSAALLLVAALAAAERFLSWVLLLPIGVTGLWAGFYHLFFPATAASYIGWQASPFQFEVGMADIAIGATAPPASPSGGPWRSRRRRSAWTSSAPRSPSPC